MKTFRLVFCAASFVATLAAQGGGIANHLVINEFQYDDTSTDNREFVELYNPLPFAVDISGWVLESVDQAWPADNNADYTIPGAVGSNTTVIPANGFYVFGSALIVPLPNQVVGATDLWENDCEAMILRDGTGAIVDMVAYEGNKIGQNISGVGNFTTFPTQFVEGQSIWGNFTSNDATMTSMGRWVDGYDTDNNGADFGHLALTPGSSNNAAVPTLLPYQNNFDSLTVEAGVPGFLNSFVQSRAIDPTTISTTNQNVIPASPQGGKAMITFDPTGGGDTAMLQTQPGRDFRFECYVYIYQGTMPRVPADQEYWGIGVRGTVDPTFYNFPILGQTGANNASGNTGVAWEYQYIGGAAQISLVDENDGGDDESVLLTIPIAQGVNDGWQRLRIEVTGNQIDAIFGGTYGSVLDGTRYTGFTSTTGIGTFWMGYREAIVTNANCRPPTVDDLSVVVAPLTSDVDYISAATGGITYFNLHAGPSNATNGYILLASVSGGTPGGVLDGSQNFAVIPVVPDTITLLGLQLANADPLFQGFVGFLDATGEGSAASTLPPLPPALVGLHVYFGYVTLSSFSPVQLTGYSSGNRTITFTP